MRREGRRRGTAFPLLLLFCGRGSSLLAGRGGGGVSRRWLGPRLSSTLTPGELFPPLSPTTPLSPLPKEYARLEKLSKDPGRAPGVGVQELKSKVLKQAPLHLVHDVDLEYPGLRLVHLDPPVFVIEDFLSAEECDRFTALAAADDDEEKEEEEGCPVAMKVGSPTFGQLGALNAARTSTTWFLRYDAVREFVERNAALLKLSDCGIDCANRRFEEPQLVRYEPGQQVYRPVSQSVC